MSERTERAVRESAMGTVYSRVGIAKGLFFEQPPDFERMEDQKQDFEDWSGKSFESHGAYLDAVDRYLDGGSEALKGLTSKGFVTKGAGGDEIVELRKQMNDGFAVIADRLGANRARTSSVRINPFVTASEDEAVQSVKAVLSADDAAKALAIADRSAPEGQSVGLVAAGDLWMREAIKAQCPRMFSPDPRRGEALDKLATGCGGLPVVEKANYAEGSGDTGGYLVPVQIASDILRLIEDSGVVVSRARHFPMQSNQMQIPNEASAVTVYWGAEAQNLTQGEGTFGQNTLIAKRISGRAAASIEMIEDASAAILPFLQAAFGRKIGRALDTEALEGDGTNHTGLISEANINSVATTTTDGEQVSYLDIVKAAFASGEADALDGAAWFMHPLILASIVGLEDSQGRPLFVPSMADGIPGTLLGFPVHPTSAVVKNRTRGSSATSNIYFGNPQRLIFGDRQTLRFDVTDTGPGWATYQIDMRLVGRFGFTVANPESFSVIVGATKLA